MKLSLMLTVSGASQVRTHSLWDYCGPLMLLTAVTAVYFLALPAWVFESADYKVHVQLAENMMHSHVVTVPHPLFHLSCIAIHRLIPHVQLMQIGAHFVPAICQFTLVLSLFWVFVLMLPDRPTGVRLYVYAVLAFLITIFGPINFALGRELFFGYLPPNIFHSPTYLLLKPLSVWVYFFAWKLSTEGDTRPRTIALAGCFTICCLLAKPNFILDIVPVLVLWALACLYRGEKTKALNLTLGILGPGLALLVAQYYYTYISHAYTFDGGAKSGIIFCPFGPMSLISKDLGLKFVLSIFCPSLIYLIFLPSSLKDVGLNLAWSFMGSASIMTYFLAEGGKNFGCLNFLWSSEIALLILCLASAVFVCRSCYSGELENRQAVVWKALTVSLAAIPHLIGGVMLQMSKYF